MSKPRKKEVIEKSGGWNRHCSLTEEKISLLISFISVTFHCTLLCVLLHFCLTGNMLKPHVTGAATSCLQLNGRLVEQCFSSSGHKYIAVWDVKPLRPSPCSVITLQPSSYLSSSPGALRWAFQLSSLSRPQIFHLESLFLFLSVYRVCVLFSAFDLTWLIFNFGTAASSLIVTVCVCVLGSALTT